MDTYYEKIKQKIIDDEIYSKVKDYSKERHRVITYFEIGKILDAAGSKYGKSIIDKYSNKLVNDVGKKYNVRTLYRMRRFYKVFSNVKLTPLVSKLSWSHFIILMSIKNIDKMKYYTNICIRYNLSKRKLQNRIRNNEYERLDIKTKERLMNNQETTLIDSVKNPIIIKNTVSNTDISEKLLKQLILENIDNFLKELGEGFSYIESEYSIKIGERYNYIDMLLFNIKYNCYVVVELKVTELKKEYLGQIQVYMNYVDKHIKTINQDKTIGIIIVKKENNLILEYCSDSRIISRIYCLL